MKYLVFTIVLFSIAEYGSLQGCKENEIISKCVNFPCQYTNCSQIDQTIECVQSLSEKCKRGCICKDKYLRADNGTCIPYNHCPNSAKCTKQNEYYELCPTSCLRRVCGANQSTSCSVVPTVGDPRCLPPTCICKVGFFRNLGGECVVASLCNATSSTNNSSSVQSSDQFSETNSTSQNDDAALSTNNSSSVQSSDQSSETNSTSRNDALSINDTSRKCGHQEVYEEFPCTKCRAFYCSELGYPLACLQKDYGKRCTLKPGCICASGFVKNASNVCIPTSACPSYGGDRNAESGCQDMCQTCENFLDIRFKPCLRNCKQNGCGCRVNYLYDMIQGKCVISGDCNNALFRKILGH